MQISTNMLNAQSRGLTLSMVKKNISTFASNKYVDNYQLILLDQVNIVEYLYLV